MKKIICITIFSLFSTFAISQTSEENIKEVQNYIQNTSQTAWFDPINEKGSLEDGILFDKSYYILSNDEVFSIIFTLYDKTSVRKVFYYKENQLIAAIIEEHDVNNSNKLLRYADYFYKNGTLINSTDEQKSFPSGDAYQEGTKLLKEYKLKNESNKNK